MHLLGDPRQNAEVNGYRLRMITVRSRCRKRKIRQLPNEGRFAFKNKKRVQGVLRRTRV